MGSGPCPPQHTPPPELSFSVPRAIWTSLPVVMVLILLPAVAFASPPDPSWIAGIYDAADGDDIVSLVYETSAANVAAPSHIGQLPCLPGIPSERITPRLPGSQFARRPRAPPATCSTVSVHVVTFRARSTLTASHTTLQLVSSRTPDPEFSPEGSRIVHMWKTL